MFYLFDSSLIWGVESFFLLFMMLWFLSNILFPHVTQYFILPLFLLVPPWVFRCPRWGCCSEQSWIILFLLSRHKPSASFFLSLSLQLYLFFKYILGVVVINRGGRQSTAECLKIGNIMKQNRYSTVDVDWNMLCLFSHAVFVMPGCWGEDWAMWPLLVSHNFPFVFPQPNQWRR